MTWVTDHIRSLEEDEREVWIMLKTRILIADDHTMIAEAWKKLLEPEYEVVGIVSDGRAAVRAAAELKPDVVLMDIAMPFLNGLDAADEIKRARASTKIVYLTMNSDVNLASRGISPQSIWIPAEDGCGLRVASCDPYCAARRKVSFAGILERNS